jgi:MFS family permease
VNSAQPGKERYGVFSQIGHAPAVYALFAALIPVTVAAMLLSTARNAFAAANFAGAQGVGNVAIASTIGGGVGGLFASSLADRYSAKRVVIIVNLLFAVTTGALWLLVQQDEVTSAAFLVIAAVDGGMIAVSVSAVAKVQASLVSRDAKGAAEAVSSIRSSVGSLLGIVIVIWVGEGTGALALASALFIVVAVLVALVTRNLTAPKSHRISRSGSTAALVRALREKRELRDIMIADSVMYLALPTALLSLGVVAEDIYELNPIMVSAGIVGVLAGRMLVAARGTVGRVPRALRIATLLYAFLALGSWYLLEDDWLLGQVVLMAAIATLASAAGSFVQSMLGAKLQEQLPEDVRARGTGVIYGVHSVELTIGVAIATWVVTGWSLHEYLLLVGISLLLATIGLRGFSRIR